MSLPPCFRLADEVFPQVRAEAARRLAALGWSQTRIGEALGISQAMVSRHIAAARSRLDPLAARLTEDLMVELEGERKGSSSTWCSTLTGVERPGGEEALDDLLAAELMLRGAAPLHLMPQIGLNLARATPEAKEEVEVLSYPGRLVDAGGQLVAPAPPAFGASGHLARCLLHLRSRDATLMAIANVRGGTEAERKLRRLGWKAVAIAADRKGDAEAPFRRAVAGQKQVPTLLHDGEAQGIEPCLYVAGRSAREVAERILELEKA